ncbi:peptidase MA family metallohydrolase [Thiohalomonas denitrificans]|uniref:Peptidase MA superfamily protein n=1 Tax=Thiohalomonas denitrificans TaxID=415747 RepID=A0A1G5QDJ8_9GAMM|nr:peptidase MA family metallohydrolase [Thiohalomonas denitrificans]SCZ59431.1 Peptidase MA superfamily protein [Thiohalomonas denitrificans]
MILFLVGLHRPGSGKNRDIPRSGTASPTWSLPLLRRVRAAIPLFALVLATGMLLSGCGSPKPSVAAATGPMDHFIALESDGRILYEAGGKALAARVQQLLDDAVSTVERRHRLPFLRPVRVHVFANARTFARESPSPNTAGVTVGGELYLSPRLAEAPEKLSGILTHELAHQHFTQYLGVRNAYEILPRWFAEGFAVVVSGAGADRVSEQEAIRAIINGEQLYLSGDPRSLPTNSRSYGVQPHMFYRQSTMFVEFLERNYGEEKFGNLLRRLFGGERFDGAFVAAFGRPVPIAWSEFVDSVKTTHLAEPDRKP